MRAACIRLSKAGCSGSSATPRRTAGDGYRYYRLSEAEATNLEEQVRAAVRGWRLVASKVGVSATEQRQLAELIDADAE